MACITTRVSAHASEIESRAYQYGPYFTTRAMPSSSLKSCHRQRLLSVGRSPASRIQALKSCTSCRGAETEATYVGVAEVFPFPDPGPSLPELLPCPRTREAARLVGAIDKPRPVHSGSGLRIARVTAACVGDTIPSAREALVKACLEIVSRENGGVHAGEVGIVEVRY